MAASNVSSKIDLFQQVLKSQEIDQLNSSATDAQSKTVTFTFKSKLKTETYTVSLNDKNEVQVTWRRKFLGFIKLTKTITTNTNSSHYKTSRKVLTLATVNPHINLGVQSLTTQALIKTSSDSSIGKRLSGIQLCSLLRNASNEQLLTHLKQLKQRKNYKSQIIPAMAKYLKNEQITFLIGHMIDEQCNREDIKLLLKNLPKERQRNFIIIPFEKCQAFSAALNSEEFQSLCLALDYQQSMALLRKNQPPEPESRRRKSTQSNMKYQELWRDAKKMRGDVSFDADKPCDLAAFPSKNYRTREEISDTNTSNTLQMIMLNVEHLAYDYPNTIKEQLNPLPCCEMAQMLNHLIICGTLPIVVAQLTDAKLAIILKSCSVEMLSKFMNVTRNTTDNQTLIRRCAKLDDRFNYIAHLNRSEREQQLDKNLCKEENKAFNQILLGQM